MKKIFLLIVCAAWLILTAHTFAQTSLEADRMNIYMNLKMLPIISYSSNNPSSRIREHHDLYCCINYNKIPKRLVNQLFETIGDSTCDFPIQMTEVRMVVDFLHKDSVLCSLSICNGGLYFLNDGMVNEVYHKCTAIKELLEFIFDESFLIYSMTGAFIE